MMLMMNVKMRTMMVMTVMTNLRASKWQLPPPSSNNQHRRFPNCVGATSVVPSVMMTMVITMIMVMTMLFMMMIMVMTMLMKITAADTLITISI